MLIRQIYNNNVVSVIDSNGNEFILTGCGLGFKAKVGDEINKDKVEKTFSLDGEAYSRFKILINEVSLEVIQLTYDIVKQVKTLLEYSVSDSLYVSLADHLYHAIERQKKGHEIVNLMQWEVHHYYPKEYLIGRQSLALIAAKTGVLLPDSEACSIALHIINAGSYNQSGQVIEITKLVYQIQNIVKYWFGQALNEQGYNFHRFITHLKFFAQRVIEGVVIENDDELFNMIHLRNEKTIDCVNAIDEFIEKNYHHRMSNSEKIYLTVHIYNLIYRS